MNRETLERRRRQKVVEPGEDGCYSTAQIAELIFGSDQAQANLELTVARKEQIELESEVTRKERLPISDVAELLDELFTNLGGILKAYRSKIGEQVFEDLFGELRGTKAKIPTAA